MIAASPSWEWRRLAAAESNPFVSRAGLKLAHALDAFKLDVRGLICADFGCNAGGFTDCLLQRGAARVYAIDTGYGALAWKLRTDARVVVMERTNVLHAPPPADGRIDLVTIDVAWTPQRLVIPAAVRWLAKAGHDGRIITLIKPHYEATARDRAHRLEAGALDVQAAHDEFDRVRAEAPGLGAETLGHVQSPLIGGKTSRADGAGNIEFLALLRPIGG